MTAATKGGRLLIWKLYYKMLKYCYSVFFSCTWFLWWPAFKHSHQTGTDSWNPYTLLHQVRQRDRETLPRDPRETSPLQLVQLFCCGFAPVPLDRNPTHLGLNTLRTPLPFGHWLWKRRTPQEWHKSSERHRSSHVHQNNSGYDFSLQFSNFLYFCVLYVITMSVLTAWNWDFGDFWRAMLP